MAGVTPDGDCVHERGTRQWERGDTGELLLWGVLVLIPHNENPLKRDEETPGDPL
jgi:hypothetical protein